MSQQIAAVKTYLLSSNDMGKILFMFGYECIKILESDIDVERGFFYFVDTRNIIIGKVNFKRWSMESKNRARCFMKGFKINV